MDDKFGGFIPARPATADVAGEEEVEELSERFKPMVMGDVVRFMLADEGEEEEEGIEGDDANGEFVRTVPF